MNEIHGFSIRQPSHSNEVQVKSDQISKESLDNLSRFREKIVTVITPYKNFYPAEGYPQKYSEKNPLKYNFYR